MSKNPLKDHFRAPLRRLERRECYTQIRCNIPKLSSLVHLRELLPELLIPFFADKVKRSLWERCKRRYSS